MTSNKMFLAAGALVAGLLIVGFTAPVTSNDFPEADASVQLVPDGRVGPRYRVDQSAEPDPARNADTSAELHAIHERELSRPKQPKRTFWERLLGRGKRAETDDAKSR